MTHSTGGGNAPSGDTYAQFFAVSIDESDGNLQDYRVVLNWQPKKWLGLGLGRNPFAINVDLASDDFNGKLGWACEGPMIFCSGSL